MIAERFIEFADVPIQLLKQEEREAKIRRKEIRSWKQSSGGEAGGGGDDARGARGARRRKTTKRQLEVIWDSSPSVAPPAIIIA